MARSWRSTRLNPGTGNDIMTLPIEGDEKSGWKPGEPKPFVNSAFDEREPAFSPDGRWLAYMSNESGNYRSVRSAFPRPGRQVADFHRRRRSFPSGRATARSFFIDTTDSKIMVVTYTASGDSFHADKPQLWSPGQFTDRGPDNYNFDLHPDGKRFAVLKAPGTEQAAAVNKVSFIFNFFDEISRKVPPGK